MDETRRGLREREREKRMEESKGKSWQFRIQLENQEDRRQTRVVSEWTNPPGSSNTTARQH